MNSIKLKQIIREEVQNVLKEAKSVPLKDLDFDKFDKILKLVTTPLTTAVLDDESEGYEGKTISGFKKFKDIRYITEFLMDFSKFYKTGNKADYQKVLDLLKDLTYATLWICEDNSAEMLKDKKLAKSLTDINKVLSSIGDAVYDKEPDYIAKYYNTLADAVARLKM